MSDLEKGMILQDDLYHHLLFAHAKVDEGISEDDTERLLPKYFVIYGDPERLPNLKGADRPLPIELKGRVNHYLIAQYSTDREGFRQRAEQSSSMNAFIRREIAAGRL